MYSRIVDVNLAIGRGVYEVIDVGNEINITTITDTIEGFIERWVGSEHKATMADDALVLKAYLSRKE
ncbi:hypothetical protein [Serratia marcescens]|uniref:hypothetical protein n=1 Tax=Serratia marcescens TaxID=615 RepID=UPI000D73DBEE|nr:hypothetical protein [Serratia marcescens]AWO80687.1 hypothetical protein C1N78_20015 [Serratia marcescens]MBH2575873.1 hypothetical protein [Serratia marcescens]MBH2613126.1 hypothetical protein [Serratia marcescens]MBN5331578.1 hypothetical protein [Serratia marcescens]HEJ7282250.1 hypothetical protein [Serratia marcescens]